MLTDTLDWDYKVKVMDKSKIIIIDGACVVNPTHQFEMINVLEVVKRVYMVIHILIVIIDIIVSIGKSIIEIKHAIDAIQ